MHAQRRASTIDGAIAEVARHQRGLIAARQLRWLGLRRGAVQGRISTGHLHCLERGVYAVGHVPTDAGVRWMTKFLRAGSAAVVSHRAAASEWAVRPSASPTLDLTYPRQHRPVPGIRFHVATLPADEVTTRNGFRVTTVPRTLFDLGAVLTEPQLELAIGEAEHLGLTDPLSLRDLLDRHPGRRGSARIKRILARLDAGGLVVRFELERRFFALVAESDVPRPQTNVSIPTRAGPYECDAVWPDARLIVELDGRTHHERRAAMQSDRERDRRLAVAGWTVVRITWEQLRDQPAQILTDLEALIYTAPPRRRSSVGRALHS